MRVLIDVLGAPVTSGGMHRYALELVTAWSKEFPDDSLVVLGGRWVVAAFENEAAVKPVVWESNDPARRFLGQYFAAAVLARRHRVDAVLSVSPIVTPLVRRTARACVVHDWRHVKRPSEFSRAQRLYRGLWRRSVASSGTVIAISEKTSHETSAIVPTARAVVIENGRDHAARWTETTEAPLRSRGAVLTFGHHSNKRPDLVLRAFARATEEVSGPTTLTILGARGSLADDLAQLARELDVEASVELPGFVPEHEYQARMREAGVVVLASTDEGFGLPVAEAAWFGIPIVVTDDNGLEDLHPGIPVVARAEADALGRALASCLTGGTASRCRRVWRWRDTARAIRSTVAGA